jgi:Rnl2 family RNA ligase
MNFIKWQSIENHYNQKYIKKLFNNNPHLENTTYIGTEKIDGANFSVFITKDQIKFGKRSSFLQEDDTFYNYQQVVSNYMNIFEHIQERITDTDEVILYGELYGEGIQKRINYIEGKDLIFYAYFINNEKQTYYQLKELGLPIVDLLVEGTFEEVLSFDVEQKYKGRSIEGIVISMENNEVPNFLIKKKAKAFLDKKQKAPKPKTLFTYQNIKDEYDSYFTENRLQDLFSKHGEIEENKQFAEYIKYMVSDVMQDFSKSEIFEEFETLEKKDQKTVMKDAGKNTIILLKKWMDNNMNKELIMNELLDQIDFVAIQSYMKSVGWTYYGLETYPSIATLFRTAEGLLRRVLNSNKKHIYNSTGGFKATKITFEDDSVEYDLSFILSSSDTTIEKE